MLALDHSWIVLSGMCVAGALCGYGLRHLLAVRGDRASAGRVSALCDQLDLKDEKLHGLRGELLAAQAQGRDLQSALAARPAFGTSTECVALPFGIQPIRINHGIHDEPAPCLGSGDGSAKFRPRARAYEGREPSEPALSRRTG